MREYAPVQPAIVFNQLKAREDKNACDGLVGGDMDSIVAKGVKPSFGNDVNFFYTVAEWFCVHHITRYAFFVTVCKDERVSAEFALHSGQKASSYTQ
jgi:hypothetical protein